MADILVIAPAWLGDLVMAQSLFKVLNARGAKVDVMAPEWNFAVLKCMPEVRNSIVMPITHGQVKLAERYRLGKELREKNYDQVIVLPNSLKSALIPFFAKIPQRTGWVGEVRWGLLNDIRKLDKQRYPLMVQRFVALAYPKNFDWDFDKLPEPSLVVNHHDVKRSLDKFAIKPRNEQPLLVLSPGAAFGEAKRWPEEYFANVAEEKLQQGWQVALLGSAKDAKVTSNINTLTGGNCYDLAGKLELNETVELISQANCVVSNDSGLLHVAAALNIPLIGIYGSTSADFTPPLNPKAVTLGVDLECRPCFQKTCRFGHYKCLTEIKPDWVLREISHLG